MAYDYTGSWWVWGKANSVYLSNSGGTKNTVVFDSSNGQQLYEGSTPPSDAKDFTITEVSMYLHGTEYATSSYTIKAWLGSSTGGTYAGETGEAHGSNTNANSGSSYKYTLGLSGGSIGLSNIRSPSNTFCIQVGTAAKTGNKILFKTSYESCWIWVKYGWNNSYSKVNNPTSVSVSRSRGTFTVSWSGASGGTGTSVSGYKVIRNTSQSESGASIVTGNTTATSLTNSPSTGTYYFGVKSLSNVSGYDADGYKWSGGATMPSQPKVTKGNIIYKSDMDALKSWINGSSTTVTKNDIITRTVGNTYNSTSGWTTVDAAWYNQ